MRSAVVFLLAAALCHLASCTSRPPVAPGSDQYSGEGETAYRKGYHHGFQDGRRGRDDNHERYHYEYKPQTETAYKQGYTLGYEAGHDHAEASEADLDAATQQGYDSGRADGENGTSPFYQRHRQSYNLQTEPSFAKGYQKGYKEGRGATVRE